MKALPTLFSILLAGPPLFGQALGSMTVDTTVDRMTRKRTAVVTWAAVDSVHSRYAYLPLLIARCSPEGKIDVYLKGVPATNTMRHDILGTATIEDLKVEVKLDGWDKAKGSKEGDFDAQNDLIVYFNGKRGVSNLLLPTDTLLLRFPTVFGDRVLAEFHLGSDSVRRAALGRVADACGWKLPD
jgi:hypothetical protein